MMVPSRPRAAENVRTAAATAGCERTPRSLIFAVSMKPLRVNAAVFLGAAVLLLSAAPRQARATLGDTSASVADDAARMKAAMVQPAAAASPAAPARTPNFTVALIKTPAGVSVREYVAPGGTVFAVSWRGPVPPDVATLLGAYFAQYRDAAAAGSPTAFGLHHSAVAAPDVTVETGGHMGDLWGRAYLPAMLPPGVDASEIE
jgi:hypothetical protein